MPKRHGPTLVGSYMFAFGAAALGQSVGAQESSTPDTTVAEEAAAPVATGIALPDSASPFGAMTLSDEKIAKLETPRLEGPVTPEDEANFDKYYYFHRNGTDVSTAYNDICECDGYARGLAVSYRYVNSYYNTTAGAVGNVVGNVLVAAIFGSAEKRRARRINMRACMSFKGYQRFGLPKERWEKFNFEEGLDGVSEDMRETLLGQQALVAARATPAGKVLEP